MEAALDDTEAAVASSLLIEDPASGGFPSATTWCGRPSRRRSRHRLARMHARIAEVMQSEEQESPTMLPEVVVEIARHLVLAQSIVGANAAIPYLIAVADDARRPLGLSPRRAGPPHRAGAQHPRGRPRPP